MNNLKKLKTKKNIFLILSIISAFIFIAGSMCTILGEESPVKFIVNGSPIKLIVPPAIIFFITFALYKKTDKAIKENKKMTNQNIRQ